MNLQVIVAQQLRRGAVTLGMGGMAHGAGTQAAGVWVLTDRVEAVDGERRPLGHADFALRLPGGQCSAVVLFPATCKGARLVRPSRRARARRDVSAGRGLLRLFCALACGLLTHAPLLLTVQW